MSPSPLTDLERDYLTAAERGDQQETRRLERLVDQAQADKEAHLSRPGALKEAAMWYADALGLPVFPLAPGQKRPATAHGFHDATTDLTQIETWWKATPAANIGAPTGILFDAFDIDGPEGMIALGDYMDQAGQFPPILALSLTPRGRHYLVPATERGNTTGLLPKVDYRSVGGYVVLPPSRTAEGTYRWDMPLTPDPARRAA